MLSFLYCLLQLIDTVFEKKVVEWRGGSGKNKTFDLNPISLKRYDNHIYLSSDDIHATCWSFKMYLN